MSSLEGFLLNKYVGIGLAMLSLAALVTYSIALQALLVSYSIALYGALLRRWCSSYSGSSLLHSRAYIPKFLRFVQGALRFCLIKTTK